MNQERGNQERGRRPKSIDRPSTATSPLYRPPQLLHRGGHDTSRTKENDDAPRIDLDRRSVDVLHHNSPVGPATSVFPRGYLLKNKAPPPPPLFGDFIPDNPSGGDTFTARSAPRNTRESSRRESSSSRRSRTTGSSIHVNNLHVETRNGHQRRSRTIGGSVHNNNHDPFHAETQSGELVEISPGLRVRLRGAKETQRCIRKNFYVPLFCPSCSLEIFCIQDASYVLCPGCRVVSPAAMMNEHDYDQYWDGGLGLGFTSDVLQRIRNTY